METNYSIIIPVYQAQSSIRKVVDSIFNQLQSLDFELILVDDGSKDNSWEEILNLKKEYHTKIKAVRLSKNYGQHSAVICGIEHAKNNWIITLDDDNEVEPKEILNLIEKNQNQNFDLVYAQFNKKTSSWYRKFLSEFFKSISRLVEGENQCKGSSYRLIKTSVAKKILQNKSHFVFIDEALLWYTNKLAFVNVNTNPNPLQKSRYNLSGLFKLSGNLIFLSSTFPLKVVKFLGVGLALVNFIIGTYFMIKKFMLNIPVEGFATIIVSI